MWSGESRFTLFKSDWCIKVRRQADEVMHPSSLVPSVQACGGSVMICGCFSWSGPGSAMLCAPKMRSADCLNILKDQVFTSVEERAYSIFQDDNTMTHGAQIVKRWFRDKFNPCSNTLWHQVGPPRERVCGPLAYIVLASSEMTAQQHYIAVNGPKYKTAIKKPQIMPEQHQTSATLETGSQHIFWGIKHLMLLPYLLEKINRTPHPRSLPCCGEALWVDYRAQ